MDSTSPAQNEWHEANRRAWNAATPVHNSHKADQAAYVSGVKRHFGGTVYAPDDLDRYCMTARIVGPCRNRSERPSH